MLHAGDQSQGTAVSSCYTVIVVIVVIGIIASISIVSYMGTQSKARDVSILSDLDTLDGIETNYGIQNNISGKAWYSGAGIDSSLNFTPSNGNVIDVVVNGSDYCIRGYNPKGTKNSIDNAFTKESSNGVCQSLIASPKSRGIDTVDIGTQTWMKYNVNTGDRLDVTNGSPSSLSIGKKWCIWNSDANCNTYGGLYTRDIAINICPSGFHLPLDTDWTDLINYTGSSNAGILLHSAPFSGVYGGFRTDLGWWNNDGYSGNYWTSTVVDASNSRYVGLYTGTAAAFRGQWTNDFGMSVRCILN